MSQPQVAVSHYDWARYVTQGRWVNYWHQLHLALEVKPNSVLIVGVGDSIVADVLRGQGAQVFTADFDLGLAPDIAADVRRLPLQDNGIDLVICCQVLEHLPLADLGSTLTSLRAVARRRLIVSLPQRGRGWGFSLRLPAIGEWSRGGVLPARTPHVFDGQHHWELGAPGSRRRDLVRITNGQLAEARTFVDAADPYRRFFVWS